MAEHSYGCAVSRGFKDCSCGETYRERIRELEAALADKNRQAYQATELGGNVVAMLEQELNESAGALQEILKNLRGNKIVHSTLVQEAVKASLEAKQMLGNARVALMEIETGTGDPFAESVAREALNKLETPWPI